MTWADGQAQKAAAYLERHCADDDGYVHIAGWAIQEAALMIRDFAEELAKVREVNAEQANQIAYWRDRAHHAEGQLRRAQQDRMARSGE